MKFQPDDPKLTAYALGELDAGETAAAAAAVENSADCRQAVEETRDTAGLLASALQTETCPALSATQRAAIETALAGETVAAVYDRRDSEQDQQPAVTDRRYSSGLAAVLAWRPQLSTVVTWATACLIAVVGWATWLEVFCKSGRDNSQQVTAYAIKLNPKPATPQSPSLSEANQLAMQTAASPFFSTPVLSNGVLVATDGIGCYGFPGSANGTVGFTNYNTFVGTAVVVSGNIIPNSSSLRSSGGTSLANAYLAACNGTWTYSGSSWGAAAPVTATKNGSSSWEFSTYNVSGRGAAIAQVDNTTTLGNAGRVVNWSTFNGGFDINNGTTYQLGGGNGVLNFNGGTIIDGGTLHLGGATVAGQVSSMNRLSSLSPGGIVGSYGVVPPLPAGRKTTQGASARAASGYSTFNGPVTVNGGGGGTLIYSGTLSGGLAKNGYGTLVLAGSNSFGGGTIIANGVLYFQPDPPVPGTETYARIRDNPFLAVAEQPLSTFSIDVDTASYANVRRFLMQGSLPPRDAVRIEEMINYFTYDYAKPKRGEPFSVNLEAAGCPWNAEHRLVRIGLKGREVPAAKRPPCNLVFLIDVSGSMGDANKLSLIKPAMRLLVEQLTENERVAIVVFNEKARVALPSTSGDRKQEIIDAIEGLQAGGCTNGGDGLRLAYDVATRNFIERGVNRVILCTDGDFNAGNIVDLPDLTRLIERERQTGVFLTALGFGVGNLKDATLERIADKGNGHYAYIDSFFEARKMLVEQMNGTLVTIAKDVKIQVEFNPAKVAGYRLIGYEDRLLRKEDFNNDRKDAGEIGAGHTVTALYEIVPAGQPLPTPAVDPLKYQPAPKPAAPAAASEEWLTVKLRYKQPDGDKSALIEQALTDGGKSHAAASRDFKFAAAVAGFGMVLRDSEHKGNATLAGVLELAEESRGPDASGYRTEFLSLVKKAQALGKR